jgi:WD40 repeat protein
MRIVQAGDGWVQSLAFTQDGRTLAAVVRGNGGGAERGAVYLWDRTSGECRRVGRFDTRQAALSPDGRLLATAEWHPAADVDRELQVTLRKLPEFHPPIPLDPPLLVESLAFALDGGSLLACGQSPGAPQPASNLLQWDVVSGKVRNTRRSPEAAYTLAASPDGRLLATADAANIVLLLTWPQSRLLGAQRLRGIVRALAFAPDGATLAVATGWTVNRYDTAKFRPSARLRGHRDSVTALAFTPDGGTLISTGDDGLVNVWDTASGRLRRSHAWGIGAVSAVAVAADGLAAAAGGTEGRVVVWDLDEG